MNRIVLGLLVASVAAGCKKQDKQAVTPGDGGPGARAVPRETEPAKPKVDAAKLDALAATEVPGFVRTAVPARVDLLRITVWESQAANGKGQRIRVHGTIEPCGRCAPPGPESLEKMKRNLGKRASEDPELIWETGELELGGTKALFAYHVATSEYSPVDGGMKLRANDNGVDVSYDDGRIHLHLAASGVTLMNATTEASLQAELSKDEMLAAVKTVFAALQPNL